MFHYGEQSKIHDLFPWMPLGQLQVMAGVLDKHLKFYSTFFRAIQDVVEANNIVLGTSCHIDLWTSPNQFALG